MSDEPWCGKCLSASSYLLITAVFAFGLFFPTSCASGRDERAARTPGEPVAASSSPPRSVSSPQSAPVAAEWLGLELPARPADLRSFSAALLRRHPVLFWHLVGVGTLEAVLIVLLVINIGRRRAANAALHRSLGQKDALLREVHHRVKNNLQVISSLLTLQTAHVATPEEALSALAESERRVLSMSLVHEMLYSGEDLSRIPAADYLESLGRQIVQPYRSPRTEISFQCDCDLSVELDVDTAVPLGLVVSELVSNSARHGRREGAELSIMLELHRSREMLQLIISDDGPGFCYQEARSQSLGLMLVDTLANQLDATLRYENHVGSRFNLQIPLPADSSHRPR